MITFSGRRIFPRGHELHSGECPTLLDVAVGLGRQSRFAGQTRDFYTVICHSIVCSRLVSRECKPYALIHDAGEAITSDVPTTWKTEEAKALELEIVEDVSRSLGLKWPWPREMAEEVNEADVACLKAEAHVLGHSAAGEFWPDQDDEMVELAKGMTKTMIKAEMPRTLLSPSEALIAFIRELG